METPAGRPKGIKVDVEPLYEWEWLLIKPKLDYHWQLFYFMLWETGARVQEGLQVVKKDLEATGVWIKSEKRKDHLRVHIPLTLALYNQIYLYAMQHKPARIWPYSPSGAWLALKNGCKAAGVRETLHPHSFRHGFGYRATRSSMPGKTALEALQTIQQMMRHTDIASTQVYTKSTQKEIEDAFRDLNKPTA